MAQQMTLPKELVLAVERLAKSRGSTPEAVCTQALLEYLRRHDPSAITTAINEAQSGPPEGVPADVGRAQARAIGPEEW